MAQVSVNITDFEQTAIHTVYEEICKDAQVMFHIFIEISFQTDLKMESSLIKTMKILSRSGFTQA